MFRPIITTLFVFAVLLSAGCGGNNETAPATKPAAETQAADTATDDTASNEAVADQAAPADIPDVEAAALDTVETAADDDAAAKSSPIVLAEGDKTPAAKKSQADWKYKEGSHFSVLTTAQGTSSSPDKIEVAEVFWYGCPHCFNFDPYLSRWQENIADDVSFVRIPVMWNPTNQIHARVFYTAEALGKLDEMHEAIFREMHQNKNTLMNEADIRAFFNEFGVSNDEFDNTFRSFAVESKLKRARNLTQRYRIRSVPVLVVNGKYVASGDAVKNFDDMLAVADELVERERADM